MAIHRHNFTDERINRNLNMGQLYELTKTLTWEHLRQERSFGGCTMTYDKFETTSYRQRVLRPGHDKEVRVTLDFNEHKGIIDVID